MASLFTIGGGKNPIWAVQVINQHDERKTIRLGRVGYNSAQKMKGRIEGLASAAMQHESLDRELAAWLDELSDRLHERIAASGLIGPRHGTRLGDWVARYIRQRSDLKPASIVKLKQTEVKLLAHFDTATPLRSITASHAKDWRIWLAGQKVKDTEDTIAEATVRQHCRNAKAFFNEAVDRELIPANPFRKLKSGAIAADRDRYVTPAETDTIIEKCPSLPWRVLVGLARLAGLRVPSETHGLCWADVDWERNRLTVRSPKTERHKGHEQRIVPIVPKLLAILQEAFDAAVENEPHVVTLSGNNLRRGLHSVLDKAGIEHWEDVWQTLRRSAETEWSQTFPQYAVSQWLGHAMKVSADHYLMIPDELYAQASEANIALQKAVQQAGNSTCNDVQAEPVDESDDGGNSENFAGKQQLSLSCTNGGARTRTGDLGLMNPSL